MKFINNFVCSIGNIFMKFHQETLSIIQNIECRKGVLIDGAVHVC